MMESSTPRVSVVSFSDRRFYQLQWIDPFTSRKRTQSAKTANRRDAERAAMELEKKLAAEYAAKLSEQQAALAHGPLSPSPSALARRHAGDGSLHWDALVHTFTLEHLDSLSANSRMSFLTTVNHIQTILKPAIVADLHAQSISAYIAARRKSGVAETTLAKDLRYIRQLLRWAVDTSRLPREMMPKLPRLNAKNNYGPDDEMRGRPLTEPEVEHLIASIDTFSQVAPATSLQAASLRLYVRGMLLSGLRISESLSIRLEPGPWISIDLSTSHGSLVIPHGKQKSKRREVAPIAPDFCTFARESLAPYARAANSPYLFNLIGKSGTRLNNRGDVSQLVSQLGRHSKIITDPTTTRYVTVHDFRRTFGARWAVRVVPAILKSLMRHATISTTERYYVGSNLERTQEAIYKAFTRDSATVAATVAATSDLSNTSSNSSESSPLEINSAP